MAVKCDASIRMMLQRLKSLLSVHPPNRVTGTSRIPSAVLVPICEQDRGYTLVFTQRTHRVSTHKGQISFPGGARDDSDASLADTALRECDEEIGLACEAVEILGQLDDCPTFVSNYVITPFVGAIPWPYSFRIAEFETAEIICIPISSLLDQTCRSEGSEIVDGRPVTAYFYNYNGKVIWGATARILNQFLELWQQAGRLT